MGLQTISDYSARALSLIPNYMLRNKAGDVSYFAQEMMALGDQVQALETAIMAVYLYRGIDAAVSGVYSQTLDDIGTIVGCPPHIVGGSSTMSDADYAIALRAQISMNTSQGEPERLISALQFLTTEPGGAASKVDYIRINPASVCLNIEDPAVVPSFLEQTMNQVKAGGVAISVQQSTARPFCFSVDGSTPWFPNGKGFGDNPTDVNGGQLAYSLFTE